MVSGWRACPGQGGPCTLLGGLPHRSNRRVSTETKAAAKTTELIAFVVVTLAMLIASQIVDGFDAQHAWLYASLLTIGYMISRGLAKSGSRDFYDDERR